VEKLHYKETVLFVLPRHFALAQSLLSDYVVYDQLITCSTHQRL